MGVERTQRGHAAMAECGPTPVISRVEILQRSSLLPYKVCYPFSGKTRGACSACPDSGNSGPAERPARADEMIE